MIHRLIRPCVSLMAVASALNAQPSNTSAPTPAAMPAQAASGTTEVMSQTNPLLVESTLPFQYPRFDLIKDCHYLPAYQQGMNEDLAEVAAIVDNSAEPSFDNTIVALERSGKLLSRVGRIFGSINATNTNPTLQAIEKELAPKLSAHSDAIRLNPRLFKRIETLYLARATLHLDPESLYLLERYYKDFVRGGAKLGEADQTKLRALNSALATLQTTFSQNVLKEVNASAVLVDTREELAGLSESAITAAAKAATKEGHEGKFLIRLVNTTGQAPLSLLTNRSLREKIYNISIARGSHGGDFDNRAVISAIARKRAERALLLGYENHAAFSLEEQTARNVGAVNAILAKLATPAVENAKREGADIQKIMDEEKTGAKLSPWDWALYTEKVRSARYAFDDAALRPYFEANRVLQDGVFFAATQLYGITFKERFDLPRYHPDTRTFEVIDKDGSTLALLIINWYARPKRAAPGLTPTSPNQVCSAPIRSSPTTSTSPSPPMASPP